MMENTQKKNRSLILWLLVILAPLIAGWILGAVSGTSPLRLDAWNTGWNDENGYFRVVRTMRTYGVPRGITGFNEITNGNIPFGPYNLITYIPYYLLSFITGTSSHNFVYIMNVILAVLANFIFILLVKPGKRSSFLTAVFFLTQLIAARYTWSGMSEASYHFFIVVFMGLVIWYLRAEEASAGKKNLAVFAMTILAFFYGVMRPYFLPLFLIPLYLIIFRNKKIGEFGRFIYALFILAAMIGALALMYVLMQYIAEYFEIAPAMRLAQIVRSGQVGEIFLNLKKLNEESVRSAINLIKEYRWAGGVTFLFYFEWAVLFLEFLYSLFSRKKDGRTAVLFLLLLSGAMIYEATILLYKAYQLHRMLLAITIAYSLFLIEFGLVLPWINCAAIITVIAFYIMMKPSAFSLPQINDATISQEQLRIYKKELVSHMPCEDTSAELDNSTGLKAVFHRPSSLDPYWENTVAKITEENRIQLSYVLPDYLSLNVCTEKFLRQSVESDSLSSRYVLVKTDSELDELCAKKYSQIFKGLDHTIYDRKKQK